MNSRLKTWETCPTEQHTKWETFHDAVDSIPVYPQGLAGGRILLVSERNNLGRVGKGAYAQSNLGPYLA